MVTLWIGLAEHIASEILPLVVVVVPPVANKDGEAKCLCAYIWYTPTYVPIQLTCSFTDRCLAFCGDMELIIRVSDI